MSWQHCEMSTAEMRLRDHSDTKVPFVFIVKFISLFCFNEILLHFSTKMICSDDFEDVIAGPSQKKKPFIESDNENSSDEEFSPVKSRKRR